MCLRLQVLRCILSTICKLIEAPFVDAVDLLANRASRELWKAASCHLVLRFATHVDAELMEINGSVRDGGWKMKSSVCLEAIST